MPESQLRLLPPPKPLVERLGRDFFLGLPKCPGVYQMFGRGDALLYVGKAKNLRQRLNSYRYTHSAGRKTVRLVHLVERIAWESLDSDASACLRENELLRTLRPRFNRVGTYPKAYFFIELFETQQGFGLRLSHDASPLSFGAFKGQAKQAFPALCRLLWTALHGASYSELPRKLLLENPAREYLFESLGAGERCQELRRYLNGEDNPFGQLVLAEGDPFFRRFHETDVLVVDEFFSRGPRRNHELCQKLNRAPGLILQEELDDLLVRCRAVA